jgi:2-keto-4-pentenoate hydratase/2-oxohepta-3-ene-1,7-dioic acid hydratase in catechol pathway
MKLLFFRGDHAPRVGVATSDGVLDLGVASEVFDGPADWSRLSERLGPAVDRGQTRGATRHAEADLSLEPCLPFVGKIVCVGLNYRRHAMETGARIPEVPILFSKFANSLAAHRQQIAVPPETTQADYEVELGVILGRRARRVSVEHALEYIAGYCVANDLSARDLQNRTSQWMVGKTLDGFLPLGPYLVSADEVPDPQRLGLRCYVNGQKRQDSSTSDMIFSVAEIISYTSRYMTLEPWDLIITGTPEGVILGMPEPRTWLKPGDELALEVDGLGRLENRLRADDSAS